MRGVASVVVLLVAITAVFWQQEAARDARSTVPVATERTHNSPVAESGERSSSTTSSDRASSRNAGTVVPLGRIGFRSHEQLVEHFNKHGREFGAISQADYLHRAQHLRDRPAQGDVLEAVRADGVITRYDRSSGAFLAVNRDRTIRTFFRPNQGETYFQRQLTRRH